MIRQLISIDLELAASHLLRLVAAFLLALPIGWDREKATRNLGLRTFPLVAMASAGFILVARTIVAPGDPQQLRVLAGLMTGIGFLGGGAIVKKGLTVVGTATAASIWCTAAVGAAVAHGRLEIAVALTLVNFLTLRWLEPIKRIAHEEQDERAGDG